MKQVEYLYRVLGTPKSNHYEGFGNLPFASILGDKLLKEDGQFTESRSRIFRAIKPLVTSELADYYSVKAASCSATGAAAGATAEDSQESDDGGLLDFFKFTLDLVPGHRKSIEYLLKMRLFTNKSNALQTVCQVSLYFHTIPSYVSQLTNLCYGLLTLSLERTNQHASLSL